MTEGENKGFTIVPNSLIDDKSLSGTEKLILLSLLRHMNVERQRAWPSIDLIAKEARITRRWVIPTLRSLEEKGYIRTEKKTGCSTRYEVLTSEFSAPVNSVHPCSQFTQPVNSVHGGSELTSPPPVNSVHPNYTNNNTNNNTNEQNNLTRARVKHDQEKQSDFSADFEIFWSRYPRKVRKIDAKKRYDALRKSGVSADELLTAAKHYADQRRGQDEKYTLHCATFLGNERWKDYLSPTVNASARGMLRPRTNEEFVAEQEFIDKEFGGDMHEYVCWLSDGKPELADWRAKHNGKRPEIDRGDHRDHATGTGETRQASIFDF